MPYQSGFRPGLFDGQTIFVPGGGGGLGRCVSHELAHLGARLVIAGRSMEKLERVQEEITQDGGVVSGIYTAELRDEEQVRSLTTKILEEHGQVHGLVNAAGANNLSSYFLTSREMYNQCFSSSGGNIVHLGAVYHRGMPGMGHNGAARAGLANLTMTSAVEWASSGVRVNSVLPGFIATTGLDRYPESAWDGLRSVIKKAPISRHGTAAEISAAVVFLMSEMAAYVTGIEIVVDGGMQFGKGSFVFKSDSEVIHQPFNGFHRDEKAKLLSD